MRQPRKLASGRSAAVSRRVAIKSTAKTRNLQVAVPDDGPVPDLDRMEGALTKVGSAMGLYVSHVTMLGRKRYPGNRHWHFKRNPKESGCLDVTYWPEGAALWVSIRNCEPAWVHDAGERLVPVLESHLQDMCGAGKS